MATDPILREFPDAFETERLLIRCAAAGDGAAVNAAICESLADLKPWMPWANPPPTVEQSEIHARQSRSSFLARQDLGLSIFLRSDGTFVGTSGLSRIDWDVPRFEIGYWCRTSLQGRGYVTEAVKGITAFAFGQLGANRVEIRCDSRNERSRRVAERALYTLEATLRDNGRALDGALGDTLVFRLLREEYEERYR